MFPNAYQRSIVCESSTVVDRVGVYEQSTAETTAATRDFLVFWVDWLASCFFCTCIV